MRRLAVSTGAAFGAAVIACAGSAALPTPGAEGKFVLVGVGADDVERDGLYVMNVDGSGLRQITHTGWQPYWSPDGRLIAYVEDGASVGRVIVVRADGSGRRVLGTALEPSFAAPSPWSPDGRRIAWGGCRGLCLFDFASSRRTRIPLGGLDDSRGFAWSPDGAKLAAVDQERGLVVVDPGGRELRVLSKRAESPAWSPDGKQVAFLAGAKLELVPASGGAARVVARDAASPPSWSRDGRRLLYTAFVARDRDASVSVLNVVTHTVRRIGDGGGIAAWSPRGSTIVFGRTPLDRGTGEDLWLSQPKGGNVRQLTGEFPTGLSYTDLDWTSGTVPAGPRVAPPDLLQLQPTGDVTLDYLDGPIGRAGTPDSMVYRTDRVCNAEALTMSATLTAWTPSSARTVTTSSPCDDYEPDSYAVTSSLDAWLSGQDLYGNATLAAMRPGSTEAPPLAHWTTGQETPDIGWQSRIERLLSTGSMIIFQTASNTAQLWRLADGTVPHAVPIPTPADTTGLIDAINNTLVVGTTHNELVVLNADGTVASRVALNGIVSPRSSLLGAVSISSDLLGIAAGNTLRLYDPNTGTLHSTLPLAHSSGQPRLLTLGAGYAVYTSGIELHLLRLDNNNDRILNLPGQDGYPDALLTTDGLFIAYLRGYDTHPVRLLYVPRTNLP